MKFDPNIHHRRSIRLRGYDYAQDGAYFVTICSQNRECLFGEIVDNEMRPSAAGEMIEAVWNEIPDHYSGVDVHEFIVMPNHVHGIIVFSGVGAAPCGRPQHVEVSMPTQSGQAQGPAPTRGLSLSDIVQRFKTMTARRYGDGVKYDGWSAYCGRLWQRNYWEHIIRDDDDLRHIREYIQNNPANWTLDKLHQHFTNVAEVGLKSTPVDKLGAV